MPLFRQAHGIEPLIGQHHILAFQFCLIYYLGNSNIYYSYSADAVLPNRIDLQSRRIGCQHNCLQQHSYRHKRRGSRFDKSALVCSSHQHLYEISTHLSNVITATPLSVGDKACSDKTSQYTMQFNTGRSLLTHALKP